MSTFGRFFRVTTFGESHCKGVGCIVDGVPPSLALTEADIQPQLTRRRPGQSKLTTPRDEKDTVTIMSGTEKGLTLGTPLALFVPNENVRPKDYKEMDTVPRPGHADYTYQMKYGTRASSGGGRASARETIGRVASGAVAEKWLKEKFGTSIVCWVSSIGTVDMPRDLLNDPNKAIYTREEVDTIGSIRILRDPAKWTKVDDATQQLENDKAYDAEFVKAEDDLTTPAYIDTEKIVYNRKGDVVAAPENLDKWLTDDLIPVRCPHPPSACAMSTVVRNMKVDEDSTGGVVTCVIRNAPVGLGEPCFDKMQAVLAHAMMSIPATKGFEIGSGFSGTSKRGSEHNDPFCAGSDAENPDKLGVTKNDAGGVLGGITSGADIYFRVAIKPVSTIGRAQPTVGYDGKDTVLAAKGRHDPCVLPRVVPLVESMAALAIADAAMIQLARDGSKQDEPAQKKRKL
ncbi:Chorismate synthase [Phytophthora megakarya]|uniref:Chorismate synthase n=1 Tax=Phytophthora megakarya TaxID=4795 RepID=A0A225VGL7_9STRA|nr:Chorismate synthase [Phytophthora megakarya]